MIAPGRFSVYLGWMKSITEGGFYRYPLISLIVDTLEMNSSFMVSKPRPNNLDPEWEELEVCGGDMYVEFMNTIDRITGPCAIQGGRRTRKTQSSSIPAHLGWEDVLEPLRDL